MFKTSVNIKGMHCRSCELLIEGSFCRIKNVEKVAVNHKKGTAEIYSSRRLPAYLIEKALKKAGYEIGQNEKSVFISENINDYIDIIISVFILGLLYFILWQIGFTQIVSSVSMNPSSLLAVLLVGITAGFSTCMALVGGLVLGLSVSNAENNPNQSFLDKVKPQIFFNAGRIFSFFILGGVIGLIGSLLQISISVTGIIIIGVSIIMFLLGLQLTGIFPGLNQFLTIPKSISRFVGLGNSENPQKYSKKAAFITGALTFFVPCGFTQAMQLYAAGSGGFLKGALIMSFFAVGTVPGLLGIGTFSSLVKGRFASKFFKFAGVVLIVLALLNASNGFNILGLNPTVTISSFNKPKDSGVEFDGKIQTVRMNQLSGGYSPDRFTVVKNIPVKWIINSEDLYSCASSIYSAKLGISKNLEKGENIFEFTPKETGQIKFSCAMGMYSGVFNVVENDKNI